MSDTVHLLTPTGKEIRRMPFELWHAVEACDVMLRRYGMQMQIICEHCMSSGHPSPYVSGDNLRNGATFTMTCAHAERRLDLVT